MSLYSKFAKVYLLRQISLVTHEFGGMMKAFIKFQFLQLGGRIASSCATTRREVWVLHKPVKREIPREDAAPVALAEQRSLRRTFGWAHTLLTRSWSKRPRLHHLRMRRAAV